MRSPIAWVSRLTLASMALLASEDGRRAMQTEVLIYLEVNFSEVSIRIQVNPYLFWLIFSRQSLMVLADRVGLIYLLQGSSRFVKSKKSLAADRNWAQRAPNFQVWEYTIKVEQILYKVEPVSHGWMKLKHLMRCLQLHSKNKIFGKGSLDFRKTECLQTLLPFVY